MSEKKKRSKAPDPAKNLDKIRKNLEDSADTLRESFRDLDAVKKNRREIAQKLRRIEDNVENVKRLLRALRRKSAQPSGTIFKGPQKMKRKPTGKKSTGSTQFLLSEEYRKLYPRKKAIVFFHKSDFLTLDEYIGYMQRKPISEKEAAEADWDDFLVKLGKWKAPK